MPPSSNRMAIDFSTNSTVFIWFSWSLLCFWWFFTWCRWISIWFSWVCMRFSLCLYDFESGFLYDFECGHFWSVDGSGFGVIWFQLGSKFGANSLCKVGPTWSIDLGWFIRRGSLDAYKIFNKRRKGWNAVATHFLMGFHRMSLLFFYLNSIGFIRVWWVLYDSEGAYFSDSKCAPSYGCECAHLHDYECRHLYDSKCAHVHD